MPTFEIETPGGSFEVEAPDQAKAMATLRAYEPSLFERVGNATYDALNALGLPGSRMRRDITNLDNAVRGAADTLIFGTSDEIAARAGALFGKNYETELERQRAIDRTGGRARLAGQIAGGVLGGTGIARSGLSLTANAAATGKGFLPTLSYSALEGGAAGAAYGFSSGEGGIANRARGAVRDAPIGAALGMGAGAVGHWMGRGLRRQSAELFGRGADNKIILEGLVPTQNSLDPKAYWRHLDANIERLAEAVADPKNRDRGAIYYDVLSDKDVRELKSHLEPYLAKRHYGQVVRSIPADAIRHILKDHGADDLPMSVDQIKLVPRVIRFGELVEVQQHAKGELVIVRRSKIDGSWLYAAEALRGTANKEKVNKLTLHLKTAYRLGEK